MRDMKTQVLINGQVVRVIKNDSLAFSQVEVARHLECGAHRRILIVVPTSRLTAHPGDFVEVDAVAEIPDPRIEHGALVIDARFLARSMTVL